MLPLNVFLRVNFYNLLVTIQISRHDNVLRKEAPDALPLLLEVILDLLARQRLVATLVLLDDALIVDQITVLKVDLDERLEVLAIAIVVSFNFLEEVFQVPLPRHY